MIAIGTYSTELEADLARIALQGVGILAVVVGVGVAYMGIGGVQLLVPEECCQAALKVLEDLEHEGSGTLNRT